MKKCKKIISLLLTIAMCLSLMTISFTYDEQETDNAESVEEISETYVENTDSRNGGIIETTEKIIKLEKENKEESEERSESYKAEVSSVWPKYNATWEDKNIVVSVTADSGILPENAELSVVVYDEDSDKYEIASDITQDLKSAGSMQSLSSEVVFTGEESATYTEMLALDIGFYNDEEKIEPNGNVNVSIDLSGLISDGFDGTIDVTHIKETEKGTEPESIEITSFENGVIEFTTDSFSTYTVTWEWTEQSTSTNSISLSLTVYIDGKEINDFEDIVFDNENEELDLITVLKDYNYGSGDYTFEWAQVTYTTTTSSGSTGGSGPNQGSGSSGGTTETTNTAGTETNPVVAIQKSAGGSTAFTLTLLDGSTVSTSGSSSGGGGPNQGSGSSGTVSVVVYFTTPEFTVEIQGDATDSYEDWLLEANISHTGDYSYVEYEWWITDSAGNETDKMIVNWSDSSGGVFVTWTDTAKQGDEVTVNVRATIYNENGDVLASGVDAYVLEYLSEQVIINFTYGASDTALPSGTTVTLVDADYSFEQEYTIGSNGQLIISDLEPGIYTVAVSYTDPDGTVYSYNGSIALHDQGTYDVHLMVELSDEEKQNLPENVDEKEDWNHIDVKLSTGSTDTVSNQNITLDIIGAKIYDENGNVLYIATEESIEGNENEWQLYFYTASCFDENGNLIDGSSSSHSLTSGFSSNSVIEITYIIEWEDDYGNVATQTFTVTIDKNTLYDDGVFYPSDGARAYNLYNYLYGTSYSSNAQLIADGIEYIDISGMSMMLVAALLCDTATTGSGAGVVTGTAGMWGLDFALDIESMMALGTYWDYSVKKTFLNHEMADAQFEFVLYNAEQSENNESVLITTSVQETLTNSTVRKDINENSTDTIEGSTIAYTDEQCIDKESFWYILTEIINDGDDTTHINYDETAYGIFVQLDAVVGEDDVIEGTVINVTYYLLSENSDGTYTILETYELTDDEKPVFEFENEWYNGILIQKRNEDGSLLKNAEFTLTYTDEDGVTWYFDGSENFSEEYTTFLMGSAVLGMPPEAEYTLTEINPPFGYDVIQLSVKFSVNDENLIIPDSVSFENGTDASDYIYWDSDSLILTVIDPVLTCDVQLRKTDEFGRVIEGAVFEIITEDGDQIYFAYEDGVYSASDNGSISAVTAGNVTIENLLRGTYYLTEVTAPDGYEKINDTITVTISDDYEITVSSDGSYVTVNTNDSGISVISILT